MMADERRSSYRARQETLPGVAPAAEPSVPLDLVAYKEAPGPQAAVSPDAEESMPIDLVARPAPAPPPLPRAVPRVSKAINRRAGRVARLVLLSLLVSLPADGNIVRARHALPSPRAASP
jgi:hypothetical protein